MEEKLRHLIQKYLGSEYDITLHKKRVLILFKNTEHLVHKDRLRKDIKTYFNIETWFSSRPAQFKELSQLEKQLDALESYNGRDSY
jgi:hypothetical protein